MTKKFKESEKKQVWRSEISFAPFNPKQHSQKQINEMKANIKRVGLNGGIIWNRTTGNLVDGHKRVMSADLIQGYDGSKEKDYQIGVDIVEMDLKTEKEQNVFQTRSRTELDEQLMQELLPDIDYKNAGLDEIDLDLYGINLSEIDETINETINELYHPLAEDIEAKKKENREKRQKMQKDMKERNKEMIGNMMAYVTLSFDSHKSKAAFMRRFDYDENTMFINGNEFSENIERIG